MNILTAGIILVIAGAVSLNGCSVLGEDKPVTTDQNLLAVYQDTTSKQYVVFTLQFHSPVACQTEINDLIAFSKKACESDKSGCFKLKNAVCVDSQLGGADI